MMYDANEYGKQAAKIRRKVRKCRDITKAEFLSGFTKTHRLHPCVIIVLYYGDDWNGSRNLLGLMDFAGIPEELQALVNDYKICLVEVKKLTDEQMGLFQTDVKQVFQMIKYAGDRKKLAKLVAEDASYHEMDEDAYDMAAAYMKAAGVIEKKQYTKGGKVDMGNGFLDVVEECRQEGSSQKCAVIVRNMLLRGMPDSDICSIAECDTDFVEQVRRENREK